MQQTYHSRQVRPRHLRRPSNVPTLPRLVHGKRHRKLHRDGEHRSQTSNGALLEVGSVKWITDEPFEANEFIEGRKLDMC